MIDADPTQMRQLLQNLIGNALKFQQPRVAPRIRLFARRLDDPGTLAKWRIFVEDNGIGFDMKYLTRIFAPFQRLHSREAFEGAGIGLTICQKIVARHNGEITARSAPGKVTTFMFTLLSHQNDRVKTSVEIGAAVTNTEVAA